jgi:hypothetical protein
LSKLKNNDAKDNKLGSLHILQNASKLKTIETVNVKQLAKHELSVEQQLYYKEITEACVGSDESRCLCYKTFFVRNVRIFVISYSVYPWQAFPA